MFALYLYLDRQVNLYRYNARCAMLLTQTTLPDFNRPQIILARAGSSLMTLILTWDFRHRSRHSLANLPAHHLRDIGLDPFSAQAEAAKPFWKD